MEHWEIDSRTEEDILDQMEDMAGQYAPKWRFDRENPDAGTALAMAGAGMYARLLGALNRAADQNRGAFFESLGTQAQPAHPSVGYVVFEMMEQAAQGVEIPAGMGLYGDAKDGEISFRTMEDLYAVPVRIREIYQVWDRRDQIRQLFGDSDGRPEFTAFERGGKNLQSHELYLSQDTLFAIREETTIRIRPYVREKIPVSAKYLELLADENSAVFEYFSEEGYRRLPVTVSDGESLVFVKEKKEPAFARTQIAGTESFWIRCRIVRMESFENFFLERILISSGAKELLPEAVCGTDGECAPEEYAPFGERFWLYGEASFGCREALSKGGSQVTLSFDVRFVRTPLSDEDEKKEIAWKWVMKKSDFREEPCYDITIDQVVWEYFNGRGWSRLFATDCGSDLFHPAAGEGKKSLTFLCPGDMAAVQVDSYETLFIRARITKIGNLYKTRGYYVSPVLSDTAFSYDYEENPKSPGRVVVCNNRKAADFGKGGKPFERMQAEFPSLYVGLDSPLVTGPVKLLFVLSEDRSERPGNLRWEYFGRRGFTEMNLVDETDSFTRTGIVTCMGSPDFREADFFGNRRYWIRIVDENGWYEEHRTVLPHIKAIYPNAVRIRNLDFEETQYFFTERWEEKRCLSLLHPQVIDIQVWVDEAGLDGRERRELEETGKIEYEYTQDGRTDRIWVRWDEVSDLAGADSRERCFQTDKNAGLLLFGDGRHGRVVPAAKRENIRVHYLCGGGERTNLKAGAVCRMASAMGPVRAVSNPLGLWGGCDGETREEAFGRKAKELRHRNRAVTAEDFEELARCVSRDIVKVRCFTGYDDTGRRRRGAVTLVLAGKEWENGRYAFSQLRDQVYRCLEEKTGGFLRPGQSLFVTLPEYVKICVRAELTVSGFDQVLAVKRRTEERLAQFLNPISGNAGGRGWPVGSLPAAQQIQNLLRDTKGVSYVRQAGLLAYQTKGAGDVEVEWKQIAAHPFALPVNGTHSIGIRTEPTVRKT